MHNPYVWAIYPNIGSQYQILAHGDQIDILGIHKNLGFLIWALFNRI